MELSIVIPVKDERDNLRPLYQKLCAALDPPSHVLSHPSGKGASRGLRKSFEILLIDDGSADGSFEVMESLAVTDSRVKVIRLRRNYGQSAAVQAGIDASCGDIVVTMDGDLQNDPADIPQLLAKLDEGYDAVMGMRAGRKDSLFHRKFPSLVANWLIRRVTGVAVRDLGCTLRAMRRDLAENLSLYGEMHRFIPVLAQYYGADMAQIPVRHHARTTGQSKYNLSRSFRVIMDLLTVKFMHSYLTRPMHVMGLLGMGAMFGGATSFAATAWLKIVDGVDMTGNPLLLLSVLLAVLGVQFISLGLFGEVLTRTYFESQGKRAYEVREQLNAEPAARRRAG